MSVGSRNPRIDLMRGVSILLVLLNHFNIAYNLSDTVLANVAGRPGPIVPVFGHAPGAPIRRERLFIERVISVNSAAAGGNASLMAVG